MTQIDYQIIVKTLESGVPALSKGLIMSINELIKDNDKMAKELSEQKDTKKESE